MLVVTVDHMVGMVEGKRKPKTPLLWADVGI
jgi:hypothetical protein